MARRACAASGVAVAGEGREAGGDKGQINDRGFIVLLEVALQPAGRDARMLCGSFLAISSVSSSVSTRPTLPISLAVASATSKFSCWSARLKTVRGWPCEVDVPPPRAGTA